METTAQSAINSKSLDAQKIHKTDELRRVSYSPNIIKERRNSFSHLFGKIFRKSTSGGDSTHKTDSEAKQNIHTDQTNIFFNKKNQKLRRILSKVHKLFFKKQDDKQLFKERTRKYGSDESSLRSLIVEKGQFETPFSSDSSLYNKSIVYEQLFSSVIPLTRNNDRNEGMRGKPKNVISVFNAANSINPRPATKEQPICPKEEVGCADFQKKQQKKYFTSIRSHSLPCITRLDNNNIKDHSYNNNNNNWSVIGKSEISSVQQKINKVKSSTMNIPKKNTSEDDFSMDESSLSEGGIHAITKPPSNIKIMSDEDGVIISSSPTTKPRVSNGQIQEEILDPIFDFFKQNTNYDLMPYSGKVIVFDIDLPVREAFQVAANNDISFASLWDSEKSCLVGMLTVTDLIDILLLFHNQMDVIQDLVTHKTIREWRAMQKRTRPDKLIFVTPEDTLLTAIHTLSKYSIHRLPVLSPKGALLHIITHSHLLAYLVQNLKFESPIFQYSLEDLGIGTYTNVVTAKMEMQLFAAVCMFAKYKVSAIPVVNEEGCVVDVFSRYDIVYFVRDGDYRLEMTLGDALRTRPRIPVFTCTKAESFEKVLRHLSTTRIHRLVCVDEYSRVVGIVSISDIFSFLMKKQEEILSREKDIELLHGPTTMEDDL